jgi:hypothetical protein
MAAREYWEIVAHNLSKAGWSWGCVSAVDSNRRTSWIADAHRGDGKRLVVRGGGETEGFSRTRICDLRLRFAAAAWSDDTCPKSLFEEIMRLRDQP